MTTTILLGTTKGAFLLASDANRDGWRVSGPHCDGWTINHVVGDPETGTIWAGGGGDWTGAGIWRSADGGTSWTLAKLSSGMIDDWAANDPDFAAMIGWEPNQPPFGKDLHSVWSLHHAHGRLHAGAKPGQFLSSDDGGATWVQNEALATFPDRDSWTPGAAGLTLHTILTDPDDPAKLWLGMSAVGVFTTCTPPSTPPEITSIGAARPPPSCSGDPICTPLIVTLFSAGLIPRICTKRPSPFSTSMDTPGRRLSDSPTLRSGNCPSSSAPSASIRRESICFCSMAR